MDPAIRTLTGVPNFPSYVSGHSMFSSAAAAILGHLIPARAQAYATMAQQAADSRIYAGIHYSIDCTTGATVGQNVGNYAVQRAYERRRRSIILRFSGYKQKQTKRRHSWRCFHFYKCIKKAQHKENSFGCKDHLWQFIIFIAIITAKYEKICGLFNPTGKRLSCHLGQPIVTTPPDKIYGKLFADVQMDRVFSDGKTFVDCIPKRKPADIVADYETQKAAPGFDLKKFVLDNFERPAATPPMPIRPIPAKTWSPISKTFVVCPETNPGQDGGRQFAAALARALHRTGRTVPGSLLLGLLFYHAWS
jgi:hypothetical protein